MLSPVAVGVADGAGQDVPQAGGPAGHGSFVEFVEVVQDASVEFAGWFDVQVPHHAAGDVADLSRLHHAVARPAGTVGDGEGGVVAVLALLAGDDEL